MKTFLTKVVWFLLPLIGISTLLECKLRQFDNQYKYKKSYLDKHADNIDVLVLGSSHAYYDINPDYFKGHTFNAGAVSQSLDLDYAILNKYKNQLVSLKSIVLPISYFSFYGTLSDSPEKWRMKDYVLYYDLDIPSTLKDHFEILSIKPKNNLKKLYRSYTTTNTRRYHSDLGWGDNYETTGGINLETSGIATASRHSQKDVYSEQSQELLREGVAYLEKIIQMARDKQIEVLLLTPPSYTSYTENLNENQLSQVIEQLEKLTKEYSNCSYVNLLYDKEFNQKDFYDSDHLNHSGAKKLSTKLSDMVWK